MCKFYFSQLAEIKLPTSAKFYMCQHIPPQLKVERIEVTSTH